MLFSFNYVPTYYSNVTDLLLSFPILCMCDIDSTNFLRLPHSSASNGTDYINATFLNVIASHAKLLVIKW